MKLLFELSEEDIKTAIQTYLNDYQDDVIRYRKLNITFGRGQKRTSSALPIHAKAEIEDK